MPMKFVILNAKMAASIQRGVVIFCSCGLITIAIYFGLKYNDQKQKQPNIVFIVADDLGWNDISWHNPNILTPNLHKLASEGVILNQSYVQPMCTPSRTAFMTGYYPFRVGLQDYVFRPLEGTGLPTCLETLGEKLQSLAYNTYLIGKWHLGFCSWVYTPNHRGFNSFFGYYNGEQTYYTHITEKNSTPDDTYFGYDFRMNDKIGWDFNGTYSTFLFTQAAVNVIKSQENQPFFLYVAFQAPHAPLEVPKNYSDLYPNIENKDRKLYSGMVTALDEGIGQIVQALKNTGHYDNTLVAFTTDNGGQIEFGGNNWPLRGNKATIWEGGTRGPAFVHGPLLKKKGYVSNKLFHAVDWFATFLSLAGGEPSKDIDGVNQWPMLSEDQPSNRHEFVYNIDNTTKYSAAIRIDDYKLIVGDAGEPSGWYPVPNATDDYQNLGESRIESVPPTKLPQLYNLKDDPLEENDLASSQPEKTAFLLNRLMEYQMKMVPSIHLPNDQKGNPIYWNGTFSPGWCKPIH